MKTKKQRDLLSVAGSAVYDLEKQESEWIERLKKEGYKAARPNDGWVNRKDKILRMNYTYFNLGVCVGDKIMLGSVTGIQTPVMITEIKKGMFTDYCFEYLNTDHEN